MFERIRTLMNIAKKRNEIKYFRSLYLPPCRLITEIISVRQSRHLVSADYSQRPKLRLTVN